jgi:hypothetical protein
MVDGCFAENGSNVQHPCGISSIHNFVFSSRALPAIYRPAASRGTMAFFHAINSFQGQSVFHVLQVKTSLEPQNT